MRGSQQLKLFIGLLAHGITLQCLPAVAGPIQEKATNNLHEFHSSHNQIFWYESQIASKAIDQLLIPITPNTTRELYLAGILKLDIVFHPTPMLHFLPGDSAGITKNAMTTLAFKERLPIR